MSVTNTALSKVNLDNVLTFRNGRKRPEEEGIYPVYGGNGILGYANNYNYENVIIIGRVGAYCGSVYYQMGKCWVSDNAIAAVNKSNSNINFCFYLLKSLALNKRRIGTSQPLLTQEILNAISVTIPDLLKQEKIGKFLTSIDKKIELNTQINQNLEAQAQVIYKYHFIDCIPYGGKIPNTWSRLSLGEMCSKITDGSHYSPKDNPQAIYPMLSVKDMGTYDFIRTECKHIDNDELIRMKHNDCVPLKDDILVAKDGSYLKEIFICNSERPEAILSSIAIFRPNTSLILPDILLWMMKQPSVRKDVADNYVSGSALPRIVLKDFKKYVCIVPPMDEQMKIVNSLASIRYTIAKNVEENDHLATLRDTLLPKLMSGEIDVSEVEV